MEQSLLAEFKLSDRKKVRRDVLSSLTLFLFSKGEYLACLESQRVCLTGGQLENALGVPAGREAEPGAQVAGDLEDLTLLVEVDGVDGEAHEAHVDAVAGRDEQPGCGRQGTAQHEATKALPKVCRQAGGKGDIGTFYLKCLCLHDCFFLAFFVQEPLPPAALAPPLWRPLWGSCRASD